MVSEGPQGLIASLFFPIYGRVFSEDSEFVQSVEANLRQARNPVNVEQYLSKALGYGTVLGFLFWIFGIAIGFVTVNIIGFDPSVLATDSIPESVAAPFRAYKVPIFVLIIGLVLGTIGFATVFSSFYFKPKFKKGSREREIEKLMPDAVSFMYALSVGGLNQIEIIEAMAQADKTYGAVSEEFRTIMLETTYFDTDYKTAIERHATNRTPSDDFAQFLMDMLSILSSGGDIESFLEDKKRKHLRESKEKQKTNLETLELFGEMYMTLSLFPLLLIVIIVIMLMLGNASMLMLYGIVYAILPLLGVAFIVMISTVKSDEIGSGILELSDAESMTGVQTNPITEDSIASEYTGELAIFDKIKKKDDTDKTFKLLRNPHYFFRDNPIYILALTVPASMAAISAPVLTGSVPTSFSSISESPVWPTFVFVYLPLYINFVPLMIFYEWNKRSRYGVLSNLSETLRKLASANDSGQTIYEAMETVSESAEGKLAKEFKIMHSKVQYGTSVNKALIEFNNRYRIPRLARTVKLISKAQEASSQITDVLTTAARASETQDELERERKSRSRMQVVIIIVTYLTLLLVMAILKTQFLDTLSGIVGQSSGGGSAPSGAGFGGSVDVSLLSMLFFHAVTIQAVLSGLIAGYIRDAEIMSGLKYSIPLMTTALVLWTVVG